MEEKDLLLVAAGQGMESKGQVLEEVVIPLPRPRSRIYGLPTLSRRPCGTSQAKDKDGCWRSRTNQPSHKAIPRPRPKIASFVASLPRPHGTSKYHDQLGYWRRCAIQAKKAANLAQGVAKKQANLASKVANLEHALVLLLATQEKKVEEQEQAQVGVQAQVEAAMAAISQGLLQRVRAGAVLSAAVKGALARRVVTERKEQEKKAEEARLHAAEVLQAAVARYVARRALAECRLGAVDAHLREVCSEFVNRLSEELQNAIPHELVWWNWRSKFSKDGHIARDLRWTLKFRGEVDADSPMYSEEERRWAKCTSRSGKTAAGEGTSSISKLQPTPPPPGQRSDVRFIWQNALWDFSEQVHAIIPHELVWWELDQPDVPQRWDVTFDGWSPTGVPMWIWSLEFEGYL